MKQLVIWSCIYLATWVLLYASFALNMDGAMNVLKFLIWTRALLSPLLLLDAAVNLSAEKAPAPVRRVFRVMQDFTMLLLLVWFSHPFTSVALLFAMLCGRLNRAGSAAKRAQQQPT